MNTTAIGTSTAAWVMKEAMAQMMPITARMNLGEVMNSCSPSQQF